MGASRTATTTPAAPVEAPVEVSQEDILLGLLRDRAQEGIGDTLPKVFSSGNTGVYVSVNLKAPDARALGLQVPVGGKVKLTLQAVVINPANSKDA